MPTKIDAAAVLKEIKSDVEHMKAIGATFKDVKEYEAQLDRIEKEGTATVNALQEQVNKMELKSNRAAAGVGFGVTGKECPIRKFFGSDAFAELKSHARKSTGDIKVKDFGPLLTRAVTSVDAAGLIFECQDPNLARVQRFYQPMLRSLIPFLTMSSGRTARFREITKMYHLVTCIATEAASGQKDVIVDNAEGVMLGTVLVLDPDGTAESITVDTVNYDTKTITALANLTNTHAVGKLVTADDFTFSAKTENAPKLQFITAQKTAAIKTLRTQIDVCRADLEDTELLDMGEHCRQGAA